MNRGDQLLLAKISAHVVKVIDGLPEDIAPHVLEEYYHSSIEARRLSDRANQKRSADIVNL